MLDTEVYVVVHENDGAALVGDSCIPKAFCTNMSTNLLLVEMA
jgi:hypothetical protein